MSRPFSRPWPGPLPSPFAAALLVALLGSLGAVRAQGSKAPSPAALQKRAERLEKAGKLAEAEKSYLAALAEHKKRTAHRPADLSLCLPQYRCQTRLAKLQGTMLEFARARALLRTTIPALEKLSARHPRSTAVRLELARAHSALGHCYGEAEMLVEAVAEQSKAVASLEKLLKNGAGQAEHRKELVDVLTIQGCGLMSLARHQEAEVAFAQALKLARPLIAELPQAPAHVAQLVGVCNSYALLVREGGRFALAAELIREGVAGLERLEKDCPDRPEHWRRLPTTYRNLSQALTCLHDAAGARLALREADRLEEKLAKYPGASAGGLSDEDKVIGTMQIVDEKRFLAQRPEIERIAREAEKKVEDHPEVPLYRCELAKAKVFLAMRELSGREPGASQAHAREALALLAKLEAEQPDVARHRFIWADVSISAGLGCLMARNDTEGEQHLRAGLDGLAKLADECPQAPKFRHQQSLALGRLAMLKLAQGKPEEAAKHAASALDLMKRLGTDYPGCAEYRRYVAQGLVGLGSQLAALRKNAEAEAALREGVREWARAAADFPANHEFRMYGATGYTHLGRFLGALDRPAEAEKAYAEAIRIYQRLVLDFPRDAAALRALATGYSWQAGLLENQKRYADALECYSRGIGCIEAALQTSPQSREWRADLQTGLRQRGCAFRSLNKMAEYERDLQRAEKVGERLEPVLLRLSRARQRALAGELARAQQNADDLFADGDLANDQWYELAELYAKLAETARDEAIQERAAARAVESLGKALERGHKPGPLSEVAAFRPLAGRADFQKVAATGPK